MMTDKCRGNIKKMNRDYLNKIEVLNFYDVLTDDQKQSFMMLIDTLRLFCEKRSREDDISVRENML
ncbi:hypothetical protein MKC70_19595 [[Clostridium] innocuum]|jgi:hypothetical protein|nr:hypothetical protein [[Clostridium] innocuum]MDU1118681.1 hypothetical protein [Erysipelotrichaceae bacterium]